VKIIGGFGKIIWPLNAGAALFLPITPSDGSGLCEAKGPPFEMFANFTKTPPKMGEKDVEWAYIPRIGNSSGLFEQSTTLR
jgi:hypothetical protein